MHTFSNFEQPYEFGMIARQDSSSGLNYRAHLSSMKAQGQLSEGPSVLRGSSGGRFAVLTSSVD